MFTRYAASFGSAAAVTVGLLLLMQLLVAGRDGPLIGHDVVRVIRFVLNP